jgi:2-isopropylmalate synthase
MPEKLIYDWNQAGSFSFPPVGTVTLNEETLRDGLQNPSVYDPPAGDKIEILHLMEELGIEAVNIGLPGAGVRSYADAETLAREIAGTRMKIRPNCAARTREEDIRPIAELSQRAGIAWAAFPGSVRYAASSKVDGGYLRKPRSGGLFAVAQGRGHTSPRIPPDRSGDAAPAVLHGHRVRGARHRVVRPVGYATPMGAYNLVKLCASRSSNWRRHPHRLARHCDRGLALANSFAAIAGGQPGAYRGELAGARGNTPTELMLVNLRLGIIERDLSKLKLYTTRRRGPPYQHPADYPVVGATHSCTATGVHAAVLPGYRKRPRACRSGIQRRSFAVWPRADNRGNRAVNQCRTLARNPAASRPATIWSAESTTLPKALPTCSAMKKSARCATRS